MQSVSKIQQAANFSLRDQDIHLIGIVVNDLGGQRLQPGGGMLLKSLPDLFHHGPAGVVLDGRCLRLNDKAGPGQGP